MPKRLKRHVREHSGHIFKIHIPLTGIVHRGATVTSTWSNGQMKRQKSEVSGLNLFLSSSFQSDANVQTSGYFLRLRSWSVSDPFRRTTRISHCILAVFAVLRIPRCNNGSLCIPTSISSSKRTTLQRVNSFCVFCRGRYEHRSLTS